MSFKLLHYFKAVSCDLRERLINVTTRASKYNKLQFLWNPNQKQVSPFKIQTFKFQILFLHTFEYSRYILIVPTLKELKFPKAYSKKIDLFWKFLNYWRSKKLHCNKYVTLNSIILKSGLLQFFVILLKSVELFTVLPT